MVTQSNMPAINNTEIQQLFTDTQASGLSRFLQLPLEIRRQIYDFTLDLPLLDQLSLLSANRQIWEEGHDYIFRRPLVCSSRLRLQAFVIGHQPDVLDQVRSLRLRLEELAPASMQSYLRNAIMGIPVQPSEHPYVLESELILSSLRMMSNIQHLSLLPPLHRIQSSAPREFVQCLLSQISMHFKWLKTLSISTETKSLDFLVNMPLLRSLRFSGCYEFESQPARLIMKQMLCLQELVIIGPSTAFLKQRKCGIQKGLISPITPDVLCNVQPLKSLTILDLSPPGSPTFLTRGMLMAIFDTHRTTLQSLCLSALSKPSCSVLKLLKAIAMSLPVLRELQLEWPNMNTDFVSDYLPSTIQDLTVAVEDITHAEDIIDDLELVSHRLPCLRDLRFNLVNAADQADFISEEWRPEVARSIQANKSRRGSRWRTTWGLWQPAGNDDS